MKRPAVFFDRDNTLIVSDGYLGDKDKVELIDGAAELIAAVRTLGYAVVIFSNQSGVARGMFTEDAVEAVNQRMVELLLKANPGAIIDRHEYCPFHPEAVVEQYRQDSELRKPKPGMILKAAEAMELDLGASWVIGDAPRDIEAGAAAGCRTILFRNAAIRQSPAAAEPLRVRPDFEVASLSDAQEIISSADCVTLGDSVLDAGGASGRRSLSQRPREETLRAAVSQDTRIVQELVRMQASLTSIFDEIKSQRKAPMRDFSVTKLLGGIAQVLALACMFATFLQHNEAGVYRMLTWAIVTELLTIALLLMGSQR